MEFEPVKEREKIIHAEVIRSLDKVVEGRRLRLTSVSTGLPAALWAVVLLGAMLNTVLLYFFPGPECEDPRDPGWHLRHVRWPLAVSHRRDG